MKRYKRGDFGMKVLIIIPAYNEAENIRRVVDNLKSNYSQYDYVVVNDDLENTVKEIYRLIQQ